MKKFLLLILALLLLAGCANEPDPTLPPTDPTRPTEPPTPWVLEVGKEWDAEGVLLEIPLTIPDGMKYSSFAGLDGDLLLWSIDSHRTDIVTTELCVLELDDGTVAAQAEFDLSEYVTPQVLGDDIYLCDRTAGRILKLDRELNIVKQWNTDPAPGSWFMGEGETLYQHDMEDHLSVRDLSTGQVSPVLEGDAALSWISCYDGYATMDYYREDTGAKTSAVLDLTSGTILHPPIEGEYTSVAFLGGDWLWAKYMEGYIHYLSVDGGAAVRLPRQEDRITLLREGYLLRYAADGTFIRLYDLEGSHLSSACVYESGSGYPGENMIWNESLGGYFFQVRSYDETSRLLFWDISKSAGGEDLTLTEIPPEDQAQAQLKQRAKEIGGAYGLTILVGEACDTVFDEFTAEQATDWDQVTTALDTLEHALESYPEGFLRQLRYDNIRGIRIQLVSGLWADGSGRYGDGYAAFTQPQGDHYLMVMDIEDTTAQTYYHEFSHIIDAYLEYDANNRPDALYAEERWADLNPGWFTGYSYDYSQEHDLQDFSSFVDGYSTIKPTEDRARVLEYAMAGNSWTFSDAPVLEAKLDYYSRCIRDAFDTAGWPEITLWEEPLRQE